MLNSEFGFYSEQSIQRVPRTGSSSGSAHSTTHGPLGKSCSNPSVHVHTKSVLLVNSTSSLGPHGLGTHDLLGCRTCPSMHTHISGTYISFGLVQGS